MATQNLSAAPQSAVSVSLALAVSSALAFSGSPVSAAVVGCTLSGSTAKLSAGPSSAVTGAPTLTGATAKLYAGPGSAVLAAVSMTGAATKLAGSPVSGVLAQFIISGATAKLYGTPSFGINASADLTGASESHGLSVCDALDEVLGMWGVFNRCSAPDFAKDAAINIINASLQLVWNNAAERNYWSNSTLTLTFAANADSQDLPDDIQNVVGPCRLATTRRPLAPIGTIGELETFADLYLDGDSATEPVAYHVERQNQAGKDPAKTVLHVTPAPSASTAFLLEVVKEAPRYTTGDLVACPVIPIPHSYVESLLLPIARYQASSFYLFRKADQKETIDREYQQARISLGLADPLPGKAGDNKAGDNKEGGTK